MPVLLAIRLLARAFLRRKNNPVAGPWWFAGGRIHKEESLEEALHRKSKKRLGLKLSLIDLLMCIQGFSPSGMT